MPEILDFIDDDYEVSLEDALRYRRDRVRTWARGIPAALGIVTVGCMAYNDIGSNIPENFREYMGLWVKLCGIGLGFGLGSLALENIAIRAHRWLFDKDYKKLQEENLPAYLNLTAYH